MKHSWFILLDACVLLAFSPMVHAQPTQDPIGPLSKASPSAEDNTVLIGKDPGGMPVCFTREQGDSHHLDIGVSTAGAFVRLESADSADAPPASGGAVRIYAGEQLIEGGKATDRFTVLKAYEGAASYSQLSGDSPGFLVVAAGDPVPFLEVVVAARRQFLVAEAQGEPRGIDYVSIYDFDAVAAKAVMACAVRSVAKAAPGPQTQQLNPVLPSPLW